MYKNSHQQSSSPYSSAPTAGTPREVEAWALTESARRLFDAQQREDMDALLQAARLNWRLWTIFQAELTAPDCAVPAEIRNNMLSLCNFVDKQSVALLAAPQLCLADTLISINREIARGLLQAPEAAVEPSSRPVAATV